MEKDLKRKIQLETNNELWGNVQAFKVKNGLKNNNDAVTKLIQKGLLSKDEI